MLSRVILPAGVILATAPLAGSTVFAAETEKADTVHAPTKTIKPSELPLYGEPIPAELEFIPEPSTPYRETVTSFRKSLWSATTGMQGTIDNFKSGIAITKEFGADLHKEIQEDTAVLKRVGIIVVAGFGGIVAGYKGGVFRKVLLASAAMTTAGAVCYPNQAVDISNTAWIKVKDESIKIYEDVVGKSEKKTETPSAPKVEKKKEPASKDVKVLQEKDHSKTATKTKEDHGQSKSEDKDMYTTRS